ncbi:MAG TPA: sulfur carrier protein ThiS [Firmicutes bacterium]|nr:sulfur carrier protein ThiS [Bacillota bacterium]
MPITVNNREIEYIPNESIKELLKRMRYIFPMIIIRVNDRLIPKERYSEYIINDGARIEIIHLISGG